MRLHDWQIRLESFIRARRSMPFAWGTNDCCTFAADSVQAITGEDKAATLRGHTTAKQAYRTIQRNGDMAGLATTAWGKPIPAAFSQIGDVVLIKIGKRDALAICNGSTCMAPSAGGLAHLDMAAASLCWRAA